jgi:hypothetical protein
MPLVYSSYMNETFPYWIRQYRAALRRARTHRKKAPQSRDPQWRINMARGAEKDAAHCFSKWRYENPHAEKPVGYDQNL